MNSSERRKEYQLDCNLATSDQPEPTGDGEPVVPKIIADLEERQEMGRDKYGTVLRTHNGRDALTDAYQEVLDLACYFRQLIMEREER